MSNNLWTVKFNLPKGFKDLEELDDIIIDTSFNINNNIKNNIIVKIKEIKNPIKIYIVSGSLSSKGICIKTTPLIATETKRCYDVNKKNNTSKKRYKKDSFGIIKTNINNSINSDRPFIAYYTMSTIDDLEKSKKMVTEKLISRYRVLEKGFLSLKSSIIEYENQ